MDKEYLKRVERLKERLLAAEKQQIVATKLKNSYNP